MEDPVNAISAPLARMIGANNKHVYPVILFLILFILSYLILLCAKPSFVYRTDKDGKRRVCHGKIVLASLVSGVGLVALYYILLYLLKIK